MTKLRRWIELSAGERTLLARAAVLLPVARLAIAMWGFNRAHRLFLRVFAKPSRAAAPPGDSRRCGQTAMKMVSIAAVHGACQANCLPRSLVTWALLRQQGFDPALRFGARRRAGEIEAHAWVMLGAAALDATAAGLDEAFVPFSGSRQPNGFNSVVR